MKRIAIAVLLASAALAGCASNAPAYGPAISQSNTYGLQNAVDGKILSVRKVTIRKGSNGAWALGGALAGGLAGNALGGSGSGKTLATVGGALAGGLAGDYLGRGYGDKPGVEISVRANQGGRQYVVIQEDQGEGFQPGDRVQVVYAQGFERVVR